MRCHVFFFSSSLFSFPAAIPASAKSVLYAPVDCIVASLAKQTNGHHHPLNVSRSRIFLLCFRIEAKWTYATISQTREPVSRCRRRKCKKICPILGFLPETEAVKICSDILPVICSSWHTSLGLVRLSQQREHRVNKKTHPLDSIWGGRNFFLPWLHLLNACYMPRYSMCISARFLPPGNK